MPESGLAFPTRPLTAKPPGHGLMANIWSFLGALLLIGGFFLITLPPIPDLIADWQIRDTAQELPRGDIEGASCKTYLVLVTCSGTLVGARGQRQPFTDFFLDFKLGDYSAVVMADPARPDHLTTDLALDKIWNRIITLSLALPLFGLLAFAAAAHGLKEMREGRRIRAALGGRRLYLRQMRLEGRGQKTWMVASIGPDGSIASRTWQVPRRARPIVIDGARGMILGVTADDTVTMPLDEKLRWLDLTRQERDALNQSLRAQG